MVAPVSAELVHTEGSYGGPRFLQRRWHRQGKPYNIPLPFSFEFRRVLANTSVDPAYTGSAPGFYANGRQLSYNKAYAKLVEQLGDQSQWGVNIAEQKQGLDMIVKRSSQMVSFIRDLRKLDFASAAKTLQMAYNPITKGKFSGGVRGHSKSFANNFLEYHFGWEPLMQDVHAAVHSFINPHLPFKRRIRGRGTSFGGISYPPNTVGPFTSGMTTNELCKTLLVCDVEVTNHNLHLASQLGLVNPLSVAWELLPFSFVVDWWANVGQVLASYTDFAGTQTTGGSTTALDSCKSTVVAYFGPYQSYELVLCSRTIGSISGPSLALKPFKGLSPVRGLTAISLLVQQLR